MNPSRSANPSRTYFLGGMILATVTSSMLAGATVFWLECDSESLAQYLGEDQLLENATAIFFGLSGLFLLGAARRSAFLQKNGAANSYTLIVALAFLMFILMGEEISWGQRILSMESPEYFKEHNLQGEITLHNLEAFRATQRSLDLFSVVIGLVLPVAVLMRTGRHLAQKFCCPVAPLPYAVLFVGSVLIAHYYRYSLGAHLEPRSLIWEVR